MQVLLMLHKLGRMSWQWQHIAVEENRREEDWRAWCLEWLNTVLRNVLRKREFTTVGFTPFPTITTLFLPKRNTLSTVNHSSWDQDLTVRALWAMHYDIAQDSTFLERQHVRDTLTHFKRSARPNRICQRPNTSDWACTVAFALTFECSVWSYPCGLSDLKFRCGFATPHAC